MSVKKRVTAPVSMRALIQRINRKLRPDHQRLQCARPRAASSVGKYFITDFNRNWIVGQRVNPEALGRELGALAEWEHVDE